MENLRLEGYGEKTFEYYENNRLELIPFVPEQAEFILDVGCGAGGFGQALRERRRCEVWGVEPDRLAAERAKSKLNRVIPELFTPKLELPTKAFDLICFNDVLEHMPVPESALLHAHSLLKPEGWILASVPNFRQFNNLWDLVIKGSATYQKSGIMDKTHLRIFTFQSVRALFEENGYSVCSLAGITPQFTRRLFKVFNLLTLGAIREMRWLQVVVVARPRPNWGPVPAETRIA